MNADGGGIAQLTSGPAVAAPTWLGTTGVLAYIRTAGEPSRGDLVVRSPDGTERVIDSTGKAAQPTSAPDGGKVVYDSTENGLESEIFVINVDGTAKRQLTNTPCFNAHPAWSPDGTKIAFWSSRDHCGTYDLYLMNADGSAQTRLTSGAPAYSTGTPSWSPDGRRLAFETTRDGSSDVYVLNADGSGVVRLTNDPAYDGQPAWSGDGTRILFQSNRTGNFDIFSMNSDGSDVRRLTTDPTDDTAPAWRRASA
jgi:Tol biopolymer transport system component